MNGARLDLLLSAARINDIAARCPELFETKVRAPGIWKHCALWTSGAMVGAVADRLLTGVSHNPFPFIWATLILSASVYFFPPPTTTIRKLKASAIEARRSAAVPSEASADAHPSTIGGQE